MCCPPTLILAGCNGEPAESGGSRVAVNRPNILLIVADDIGYSDVGVFGSEIVTPNIDAIAAEGIMFTQFHASPNCGPTR